MRYLQRQATSAPRGKMIFYFLLVLTTIGCGWFAVKPRVVTEPARYDTDDPAIWIHPENPARSLVLGTDKGNDDTGDDGAILVYDLNGRILSDRSVYHLKRPNNIDVEYGFSLGEERVDIAVFSERYAHALRVFRLPEMVPIDNGGIPVFQDAEDEDQRLPMGVGIYKRPGDGAIFAVVSRKSGPSGRYLAQYRLRGDSSGSVSGVKVREFGLFSGGKGEIEALAVDDGPGYIYCSDELYGIRKYHADPDHPEAARELAVFGQSDFKRDREGIAIYPLDDRTGYIIVSDQQARQFQVYSREGSAEDPHDHRLLETIALPLEGSDGCEVTAAGLNQTFASGLFVAMCDDRTFQFYAWKDLARGRLRSAGF